MQSTARNIPEKEKQTGLKIYIQTKKMQTPAHVCQSNTNCSKGNKSKHISRAQIWKKVQTVAICSRLCKDQKLNV